MEPNLAVIVWARRLALVALVFVFSSSRPAGAAPPPNDNCAGAIPVTNVPVFTQPVDVSEASTIGDPPLPMGDFNPDVRRSVWYKFQPPRRGLYTLSVAYDTATTVLDTAMAVYTTSGGGCDGATNLYAYNDDSGLLRSALTTTFTNTTDYYVVVWVASIETGTSNLIVQLHVTEVTRPTNDTCAAAEVITGVPFMSTVADNTLAQSSPAVSPSCVGPGDVPSRGLWYRFQPATTATYIFSTKADETQTTVDDTIMAIYTSASPCTAPFTELSAGCNDNGVGRAVFAHSLNAGTTYYIVVWDNSPDPIPGETQVQLRVSPAGQPSVTTLPVVSIASTGAVLNGTVNANGLQSRFWFEWGPTAGLGSTSQTKLIFANSTTTFTTNLAVSGTMVPGTVYHYRFVANNSLGTTVGGDQTFMWSNVAPDITPLPRPVPGNVRITFPCNPYQLYQIQSSVDMKTWQDVGVATNSSTTNFLYVHPRGGGDPNRYYRARLP
jgi:hypothetical protein